MKHKALTITAILFFLTLNTRYYWEPEIGSLFLPVFLLLVLFFIILAIILAAQAFFAYRENFMVRGRLVSIATLATVLLSILIKPAGIIDFEKWEGKDLLVAEREGGGGCHTILRLKEHGRFKEQSVCFGIDEITGNYVLRKDTIYFENVKLRRSSKEEYFRFAVINRGSTGFDLIRYKDQKDTAGNGLFISKNELPGTK
jgi:predicted membrane protein